MIRTGEYKSKYNSVRYDRGVQSIKDIVSIITEFSPYYKVIVQNAGLNIINIKHLSYDKSLVEVNDVVIVDDFGIRIIKKVSTDDISNIKKEKLTPILLKMKFEKDTGYKIFHLSSSTIYNQIHEYINWLEEQIIGF